MDVSVEIVTVNQSKSPNVASLTVDQTFLAHKNINKQRCYRDAPLWGSFSPTVSATLLLRLRAAAGMCIPGLVNTRIINPNWNKAAAAEA